ncbi:MAG TPA: M2 family metallopeptidase [Gemmatimonadales bacterium]|nr:M2 family metallopeptidase [Gemmatimonadales bacterium]
MPKSLLTLFSLACLLGCGARAEHSSANSQLENFLSGYNQTFQRLTYASQLAEWESNTHIVDGDSTNAVRTRRANEDLARFVGSSGNIAQIQKFLEHRDRLSPLDARELDVMLYAAAEKPQTAAEVVSERIVAETKQTETLYGFQFKLHGKPVTPNQIDDALRSSRKLADRRAVWEASKTVGPVLKPGLVHLRDLRNRVVQTLGYPDYFSYQVSDYSMSTEDMLRLNEELVRQLRPLYRELHTWARYELAKRYGVPVPDQLPAHWLPNRWGQDWSGLVEVKGLDLDRALSRKSAEWVVRQGEAFYRSLGFDSLPTSFWTKSSLYPLAADAPYKKNTHASAWHLDLDRDVRSLMSVEPNREWYETVHHELGHIYYYLSYSRPEVPIVLRSGANRAYHEGIGSMIGLASLQRRFLAGRGVINADTKVDSMAQLLQEALAYVVFIPFAAGTMTRFEHALYAGKLPPDQFNATWWELARKYQGIVPPAPRDEHWADALTKTHINDDPAQYYDYALSYALLFQLHDHIARQILHQDPHDTDYYGHREVGDFLRQLMAPGASRPWREVLKETTGRELDAKAMVEYFEPLYQWLKQQNQGRTATLPNL